MVMTRNFVAQAAVLTNAAHELQVPPARLENRDEYAASCAVVICTHNRPTQLDRCLEAVTRLDYPQFDVLVVDNASGDERTREVAARWGVGYIFEPVIGASRARNCGARACHTEIVAFLDDDAVPEPAWLSSLTREFEDPQVFAVGGRILALSIETEAELLFASMGGFDQGRERREVDRQTPSWFEIANFGGIGDGNMAFRRCAFDEWPGFDERLGRGTVLNGGEEHHAFFSLIDQGYRAVYTPDAIIRHPYPRTMQDLRARHLKHLAASTGYFTFLFVEEPQYRRFVIKYVTQALAGMKRTWRAQVVEPQVYSSIAPWWRRLLACSSGPLLYAWSRFEHSRSARARTNGNWSPKLEACHPNDVESQVR